MAVYSYTPLTTPGPYGTTYTLRCSEDIKIVELFKVMDKVYVYIQDDADIPEQPSQINFKEDTLPSSYLVLLKRQKSEELTNLLRDFDKNLVNKNITCFSSLGVNLNADYRSILNIRDLIDATPDDETVVYRTADNMTYEASKSDLATFKKEMEENFNNLYSQGWAYADKIDKASSVDELEAITFKFEMKDFS